MTLLWLHVVDRGLLFSLLEDPTWDKLCGMQFAMGKTPIDFTGLRILKNSILKNNVYDSTSAAP